MESHKIRGTSIIKVLVKMLNFSAKELSFGGGSGIMNNGFKIK